ncbi:tRNA threonylcarbamoyladenosine dehydratase [Oceanivirga salmonicida]|uniref:tRNA threonylcarbamoyladenosine dehydratase n=1 Tax=Oceanivirga salmonicida TaxID=1769291 RepID=UPI000829B4C9|nr:tRNA threonylcarbamoyladenosine dehydratase [Oceanivirga salmonicida]
MNEKSQRLEILIKQEGIDKLRNAKCIIFGLGGVGSFAAEALARSFVGNICIVDYDTISISNINRQLHANIKTIGLNKTDEIANRILSINPECNLKIETKKLTPENIDEFNLKEYDYVLDAIDDISSKIELIKYCSRNKIKIISSMGMGNKIKPEKIKIDKLKNTKSCALARKLRRELKDFKSALEIPVVYSDEVAIKHEYDFPGSTAFNPPVSGMFMSSYVVRKILNIK